MKLILTSLVSLLATSTNGLPFMATSMDKEFDIYVNQPELKFGLMMEDKTHPLTSGKMILEAEIKTLLG